jgi:hypothetical protein
MLFLFSLSIDFVTINSPTPFLVAQGAVCPWTSACCLCPWTSPPLNHPVDSPLPPHSLSLSLSPLTLSETYMSSLMNLMEHMVGEGEVPHGQASAFVTEKSEDEYSESLYRDLREIISLARDDETRCIVRTLSVILQMAADTRSHVREVSARLDEMASNTKDLRQRTTEVLATVEKENCLNIPQVFLFFFESNFIFANFLSGIFYQVCYQE